MSQKRSRDTSRQKEASMDEVMQELDELQSTIETPEQHDEFYDVLDALERLPGGHYVSNRIDRYTTRDVAEGFVGSILISLPLLVEDGVFDIANHFLSNTVAGVPVWLVANVGFVVLMTWGLLYWTDFRELHESNPIFGLVPRRLVGVLIISLITASMMMTMWGRATWDEPAVAFARISVIWTAAAFGAVLGDILPGESSGTELEDVSEGIQDRLRSD